MPNSSAIFRPGKLHCLERRKNEPASRSSTMTASGDWTIQAWAARSFMTA